MMAMADQSNVIQDADIKEVFALFDIDHSGTISEDDLETAMRCMGKTPSEADKREVEDGNITQSKFIELMKSKAQEEDCIEEFYEAFKVFDKEGYGLVSAADIRKALADHGGNLSQQEADDLLKDAEIDIKDAHVDYSDLVQLMKHTESSCA